MVAPKKNLIPADMLTSMQRGAARVHAAPDAGRSPVLDVVEPEPPKAKALPRTSVAVTRGTVEHAKRLALAIGQSEAKVPTVGAVVQRALQALDEKLRETVTIPDGQVQLGVGPVE